MSESRKPSRFAVYLLPAVIAQSMIIGGGYATGREIMQFAGRFGPPGWIAVALIFVGFGVLCALAFEVARIGGAYDYKSWARLLIGPLWPLFDVLLLTMLLFVIAVMSAAIGSVLLTTINMPIHFGLVIAFVFVGFLTWKGTAFIERFKTIGSVALYIAYICFAILVLTGVSPKEVPPDAVVGTTGEVVASAIQYVGYNLAVIPPVLFCLYRQKTRTESLSSGLLAGFAMTVPFALTFLCLMRFWPDPDVIGADVPWLPMLEAAGAGRGGAGLWISVFGVVAGWTLLETAVGGIHAITDRIEHNLEDLPKSWRPKSGKFSNWQRAAISVAVLAVAVGLAQFGIVDLVAKGYGALAWGFIALMAVPLLTVGVYRIVKGETAVERPVAS